MGLLEPIIYSLGDDETHRAGHVCQVLVWCYGKWQNR